MNKQELKQILRRGLGRGILTVRENPGAYRDVILWACRRELAFDPQCEGSRAWYVYQLICCDPDKTAYRQRIVDWLLRKKPGADWDLCFFAELLSYFAQDGDTAAEAALWEKYLELLEVLRKSRRRSIRLNRCRDDFEPLCVALAWNEEAFFKIARDVGELFLQSRPVDAMDFEWLYDSRGKGVNRRLEKCGKNDPALQAYLQAFAQLKQEEEKVAIKRLETPLEQLRGRTLSVHLMRADEAVQIAYAERYLSETEPSARGEVLTAFSVCPYPGDPAPLLQDAQSPHAALREAALTALQRLRHPAVRAFALENFSPETALILIKNYEPQDEALLYSFLRSLKIDPDDGSCWHEAHMQLLKLFDPDSGVKKPPKALLPLLYETTLCSFCREQIVRLLARYRMIPPQLWEELRYDCNEDVRRIAAAHFRRRNKQKVSLNI